MINSDIKKINKIETFAYEHYSSMHWEEALREFEQLYQHNKNNSYLLIRMMYIYCFLLTEFGVAGYSPENLNEKLISHQKKVLELYEITKNKFKDDYFFLWIMGYMLGRFTDKFMYIKETYENYEKLGINYIKNAFNLNPNQLIIISNINICKEKNIVLNKNEIISLNKFKTEYFKNHGLLGIQLSEIIEFNLFIIFNNYNNPLVDGSRTEYNDFISILENSN